MSQRVVFDTNSVVSALLFPQGHLIFLRRHWQSNACVPLLSRATASELSRVLAYPKFRLSLSDREELLADYLPYCDVIEVTEFCDVLCRDLKDQIFLDLAQSGKADLLVSGDQDLLVLAGQTRFSIVSPHSYSL